MPSYFQMQHSLVFKSCLICTQGKGIITVVTTLQHQARSIIFLENHYGCVFPWGRSWGGENRSSGMTVSSDLITSGARPDSGKVISCSFFCVSMLDTRWNKDSSNEFLASEIRNFTFWILFKSGCNFCVCEQNDLQSARAHAALHTAQFVRK